jgi:prepilin-type N-terminal cleavage/methylation domain-containing protein
MSKSCQRGFTLVEIIMVLLLCGVVSVFASFGFTTVLQGYTLYKTGTDVSRKSQLVMARIIKEFSYIDGITSSSLTTIGYQAEYPPAFSTSGINTLSYAGDRITLNGQILADKIVAFQLRYCHFQFDSGTNTYIEVCNNSHSSDTKVIAVSFTITENGTTKTVQTKAAIP